ncbi:MAG: PorT family protein [Chitinophagaceae bacterium]|nr:MAG: PorT family protein [Chitinophagaceae bacterium]
MKKIVLFALLFAPLTILAQFGVKAGLNFANVTKASSINNSSKTGFHAGVLFGSSSQKVLGVRTELLYSKQGYDYKTSSNTGNVNLDYLMSSNLTCINITKYLQLQAGFQMAYLLNAKVDSNKVTTGNAQADKIMDMFNRFDYGFAGGVEIHPVAGLLIGARANISLGSLYKDAQNGQMPSFSSVDLKNNVFQLFLGWRFGQQSSSKKKTTE